MDYKRNISLDFSILYRCMHKYYDLALDDLDISAAQVNFLTIISEEEGLSLVKLANICSFDKGTVTKGVQKLEEKGYLTQQNNLIDKRVKGLYLTSKAKSILARLFLVKQNWWEYLSKDIDINDIKHYLKIQEQLVNKAKNYLDMENLVNDIKFFGLQKTTLLDYPHKLAATIFTGGCNFCCPFCHNSDLVFLPEGMKELSENDILNFLESRKGLLDGICISGGEPLLHKGLKDFIIKVKELGLLVKLDTNGYNYNYLKELIELKLVDYVALDVKNSKDKYAATCGLKDLDLSNIDKSINLLKENLVDYEFRTTIVKEFHDISSINNIKIWLKGAKRYCLQAFRKSDNCINKSLNSPTIDELNEYKKILETDIKEVIIRGL